MRGKRRRIGIGTAWVWVGTLGVCAGVFLALLTPFGIGLSRDSSVYFDLARSITQVGRFAVSVPGGHFLPISHFPPLYPTLLAFLSTFEMPLPSAARLLAILLYVSNVAGVSTLVYWATQRRRVALTAAAFFWGFSQPTLMVHTMAWSEPLALCFALAGIWIWMRSAPQSFASSVVFPLFCFTLAFLSRYAALAYGVAFAVIITQQWGSQRRLPMKYVGVLLLAISPALLWLIRNRIIVGDATNRSFSWHIALLGPGVDQLREAIPLWLFPEFQGPGAWAVLFLIPFAFVLYETFDYSTEARRLVGYLRTFALTYFALVTLTIMFFDAETPMDTRILFPLQTVFWMASIIQVHYLWVGLRPHMRIQTQWVFMGLLIVYGAVYAYSIGTWGRTIRHDGQEYASQRWQRSGLIYYLRKNPPKQLLYSNLAEVISLYTGQTAFAMPAPEDATEMMMRLQSGDVILALFFAPGWPVEVIDKKLLEGSQLKRLHVAPDGVLYGA